MNTLESLFSPENTEKEKLAREIANGGDFASIESELRSKDLLKGEVERVTTEYYGVLDDLKFLTTQDLEMFTILELYDKELALHSIKTYLIAKEKVEKTLAHDVVLISLFAQEGVSAEQFFRACLLHDIGKVEVPNFILNNTLDSEEMNELLKDLVINIKDSATVAKLSENTDEELDTFDDTTLENLLVKYNLRPSHFVPIKYIVTPEELKILAERNFDINLTLMDIIQVHEKFSGKILTESGLEIEGALAGSHHNYHGKGSKHSFRFSTDALKLSADIAELIRIADLTEALEASRSYKQEGFSRPHILKVILEEVRVGKINPKIAYLWIDDEIKILENTPSNNFTQKDKEDINFVKERLEEIYKTLGDDPFPIKEAA